jgi:outer membrane protein assembly factor BamD
MIVVRASTSVGNAVRALVVASVALGLGACSGTGLGDGPVAPIQDALRNVPIPFLNQRDEEPGEIRDAVPAGRLYNEGLLLLNQRRFPAAAQRFQELDRTHPHSELARRAILMTAYARYQQGDYESAAAAAERYVTLHPGSPEAAYARFLQGDSNFRMIPDVARDQGRAERALAAMNEIIQQYPDTEYARAAQRRITIARDQMAGKEMDVGRYYLQQRAFGAAANRFRGVVQNYQTTRHVEEALYRLVECYLSLGVQPEAQTAAAVLGHNFPDSPWYRDAFALLQSRGLQPQANESSWIARALRGVTG